MCRLRPLQVALVVLCLIGIDKHSVCPPERTIKSDASFGFVSSPLASTGVVDAYVATALFKSVEFVATIVKSLNFLPVHEFVTKYIPSSVGAQPLTSTTRFPERSLFPSTSGLPLLSSFTMRPAGLFKFRIGSEKSTKRFLTPTVCTSCNRGNGR